MPRQTTLNKFLGKRPREDDEEPPPPAKKGKRKAAKKKSRKTSDGEGSEGGEGTSGTESNDTSSAVKELLPRDLHRATETILPSAKERLYPELSATSPVSDGSSTTDARETADYRLVKDLSRTPASHRPYSQLHPAILGALKPKAEKKQAVARSSHVQLAGNLPPITSMPDIMDDICRKLQPKGLAAAIAVLGDQPLRIFTMCSGTEAPIIALELFREAMVRKGLDGFEFDHVGSAEIEPFKQGVHR